MKGFFGLLSALLISATAQAQFGIEAGFRQQSGSTSATGVSTASQVGYTLGVSTFFPMADAFGVRTGLFYVQRPLKTEADSPATGSAKLNLSYFDVPVLAAYRFEEYALVFAGPVLALKLEESMSDRSGIFASDKIRDATGMIVPLQFGASFKFAPQLGATVYFETIPGAVADKMETYRAVGANIVFTYD